MAEHPDQIVPDGSDAFKRRLEGRGADHGTVRTFNRQLILNYLREHGPTSRAAIAKGLDLSRATVSSIIDELEKDKLVHEGNKMSATNRGGRRPTRVHFNVKAGYIIGVDLGRSHLRIYLTNLEAEIVDQSRDPFDAEVGWEWGLQFVVGRVDKLVKAHLGTWNSVRGIGLSIPGTPDPTSRQLISPPELLKNWRDVDIPAYLKHQLKLDESFPIYLDNDANMGALGESRYGRGYGIADLIYVKLSTGIGAGLILNGQLYRGSNGIAGEFGHIIVEEHSQLECPSCGRYGCLEAVAGLRAIVSDAYQGASPSRILFSGGADISPERMADVILEAQRGDATSRAALERAGKHIGTAIGSYLINVYNPSLILLDGGIVRPTKGDTVHINEPLLDCLRYYVEASSLPAAWAGTKILLVELGDDAVGLGAIATVLDKDAELNMPNGGIQSLA